MIFFDFSANSSVLHSYLKNAPFMIINAPQHKLESSVHSDIVVGWPEFKSLP